MSDRTFRRIMWMIWAGFFFVIAPISVGIMLTIIAAFIGHGWTFVIVSGIVILYILWLASDTEV